MRWMILVFALVPSQAIADWARLDGAAVTCTLSETSLSFGNGATQHFFAWGRTLYTAAKPSWGTWRTQDDQYFSLWPPNDVWDCFTVETDDAWQIAFEDAQGNRGIGQQSRP
jgi:hypothetical protein